MEPHLILEEKIGNIGSTFVAIYECDNMKDS